MRKLTFALGIMAVVFLVNVTRADVVVTVGNVSLGAGESGYVPVFISSNASDQIGFTGFEFRITTAGATRLEFTNSPDPGSDPTFSNSNYIFFGNSTNVNTSSNLGNASPTAVPNDTFTGGDSTFDSGNVTLTGSNVLLAELPVTALTSLAPVAGNTFTISLIPGSGSGFSGSTGFANGDLSTFANFSSHSGTVNITATPLPKPLTALMALLGMLGIVVFFQRRTSPAASNA